MGLVPQDVVLDAVQGGGHQDVEGHQDAVQGDWGRLKIVSEIYNLWKYALKQKKQSVLEGE